MMRHSNVIPRAQIISDKICARNGAITQSCIFPSCVKRRSRDVSAKALLRLRLQGVAHVARLRTLTRMYARMCAGVRVCGCVRVACVICVICYFILIYQIDRYIKNCPELVLCDTKNTITV